MTRTARVIAGAAAAFCVAGCAAAGTTGQAAGTIPSPVAAPPGVWRVTTLEHVDLWLHGFAMLTSDTGHVPFFERGYKQEVTAAKRQRNLFTQLDANAHDLSARFATNPSLTNAQFIAMYFPSFQEILNATDLLIRSQGNPRAASDPQMQQELAILASNFPQAGDRNWLRLFVQSLQDESTRFYHAYWANEQTVRGAGYAAFQEAWASKYYPKLSRFLNNTQQASGQVVLSVPLGGEGRTISDSKLSNMIAVNFPRTVDRAPEALFTFVHEAVGRLADEAITDNVTPAERRSGAAAGYSGTAAVRGGAVLLQKVSPELVPDYMRFYMKTLGITPPAGDPSAAFASAFPLPQTILTALSKQIDVVMGGI